MRARRSLFEWPRLIFIHLTTRAGGVFVLCLFCALWARTMMPLPVPRLEKKCDNWHGSSRLLHAGCECVWVALEAFNP